MPWNPSNQLVNGLSIASAAPTQVINKPNRTLASLSGPGPSPSSVMKDQTGPGSGPTIYRYPNENLMYYMKIETRKYTRTGWNTIGKSDVEKTIILPMAMQLVDQQSVKYSAEPLGVSGAIGLGLGGAAQQVLQSGLGATTSAVTSAIAGTTGSLLFSGGLNTLSATSPVVAGAVQGVLAATGTAQNEFLTVMLNGPDYKERSFQWVLSPNSADETKTLNQIIQIFNNAQAPTLSPLGYAFFQYPRIFNISFRYKADQGIGDQLYYMRPMVLLSAQYNYTPHGTFAPFAATQGPNAIELQLVFQELELWVNNSDNDLAYKPGGPTPTISSSPTLVNPSTPNNPAPPSVAVNQDGVITGLGQ